MSDFVYTIGHSTHSCEKFIELLKAHDVTAVADVRSHPASRFNPQFNRESLRAALKKARIAYVYLGQELGARPEDRSCYIDGTVDYDRLARTDLFQSGLTRIAHGLESYQIALVCAEKDPLTCHRTILICRHLATRGIAAQHILDDGRIESHDQALVRLLEEQGLTESDLFRNRDDMVAEAYDQRSKQIAYSEKESPAEELVRST